MGERRFRGSDLALATGREGDFFGAFSLAAFCRLGSNGRASREELDSEELDSGVILN